MKVIIIGATHAAVAAAARLRRLDEGAEIILIDHRHTIPGLRLGRLQAGYNIDVRLGVRAAWDDEAQDSLVCEDLASGQVTNENFDKIVFSYEVGEEQSFHAPRSVRNMFYLSNPVSLERGWSDIAAYLIASGAKSAEVRGNDLLAYIVAARLLRAGIETTLCAVNAPPQTPYLPDLDIDTAAHIAAYLGDRGLRLGDAVEPHTGSMAASISDGIVIECVPYAPQLPEFVQPVDSKQALQEFPLDTIVSDRFSGEKIDVPRLSCRRGRTLAAAVLGFGGANADAEQSINIRNAEILGKRLVIFGLTEHELNRRGMKHIFSVIPIDGGFLKLLYNDLGQILGFAGFATNPMPYADVLAMFVQLSGGVQMLAGIELSDEMGAINIMGQIAQNVLEKRLEMAYWDEIAHIDAEKTILLDARSERDFAAGSIPNALNIPLADLRFKQYLLEQTKDVIVFCGDGRDSYVAARILAGCGIKVRHLTGGLAYCSVLLS